MNRTIAVAAVLGLSLLAATGCGSSSAGGTIDCVTTVRFRGVAYDVLTVGVAAIPGDRLGTATEGSCPGTGDPISVLRFPGASPHDALLREGQPGLIFLRRGLGRPDWPVAVDAVMRVPRCVPSTRPITLAGVWEGILGADGNTEVDMKPPYDLDVFVARASPPRYRRAYLTVRVPAALGRPIPRADVRNELGRGGTLTITAHCAGGRFIADSAQAHLPA